MQKHVVVHQILALPWQLYLEGSYFSLKNYDFLDETFTFLDQWSFVNFVAFGDLEKINKSKMATIRRNSYDTRRHQLRLRILKEAFWTYCLPSRFRCHRFNIHGDTKGGRNPAAPPYPLVPEDRKKPGLNRVIKPLDNYFIYCYGYTDTTT